MPNLFANAFASDSEDESAPVTVQQKKQAPAAKKPAATPVELAKSRNPDTAKKTQPQDKLVEKVKEPQAVQKDKRPPRTNQSRPNRPRNTENDFSAATGTKEEDHQRSSIRGRGRGKDRGGEPGQRRVFDRHSGTGRDRGMKKGGAGAHNWGDNVSMTEEAKKELIVNTKTEAEPTESKEVDESKPAEQTAERETKQEELAEPVVPEKPQFTLEEYMARKQGKRSGLGFEEKHEAEVEDLKEGRAYAKQDMEDAAAAAKRKAKKAGKEKTPLNIALEVGFKVKQEEENTESYRGRGRGRGRGAFRGGPRRGGFRGRGGHGPSDGVDVSETNFPELGA